MAQEKTTILWNKQVAPSYYYMGLESETIAAKAKAGQFVMLRAGERLDPLLRRPFSIHQVTYENDKPVGIELLYKVVGRNTELMSGMNMREKVDIVGPLGKGFTLAGPEQNVAIISGGIGTAPVVYLAAELVRNGLDPAKSQVFIGGRSDADVLCRDIFEMMGYRVTIATDDGSAGTRGLVTDIAGDMINTAKPDIIYACGPHPMLVAVADMAKGLDINCEISIETLMACGMGACLGCAVKKVESDEKFGHICIDGPVFNAKELALGDVEHP